MPEPPPSSNDDRSSRTPSDDRIAQLTEERDEALRSAQVLGITLASISDPVFITDPEGEFTYVCPNVHVQLGYSAEEVQEMGNARVLLGELPVSYEDLARVGEIVNVDCVVHDKGGRRHELLVNIKHISIGRGTALYVCRDVTERREARARIRLLREELTHLARVSTLGEFATGLAHELNQPLTTIANFANGSARGLRSGTMKTEEALAALDIIGAQAKLAGEIVRRLRRMVRRSEPARDETSLPAIVEQVADLVRHDGELLGVMVTVTTDPERPTIVADRVQLQQVFLNLTRNSLDALRDQPGPRRLQITCSHSDDDVFLRVQDNGPGIDPAQRDQVFEAFYTTRPEGMGLGLAISRSIVEDHGGRLWIEQRDEPGTSVCLTLPRPEGEEYRDAREDRSHRR
jgi:PAS domain S-box-containing protein